jgi:hypothetical protein
VIAVDEHAPAPAFTVLIEARRIEVPRGRDLETLHAAREACLVGGLDEKVEMIVFEADVHDPEPVAREDRS